MASLGTYYKCPISQHQGQLRATVAASVMCLVLLTEFSAAATFSR